MCHTGIKQKYCLVTCNYPAREKGVTKGISITEAIKICPEIVVVNGEDLTHYREMSYKISGLICNSFEVTSHYHFFLADTF